MRRFNLFVVFIFAFGFFSSAGAQTYETFTRELMTQLEVHLDHEYYKDIQEKDRQTAFEVLQSFQGKGVSTDHPKLVLTAGAMTSGKTTAFQIFEKAGLVDRNKIIFIDPDEMKNLIPGYLDRVKNHDATAGSNYHLLSMYIGDILLGWAFLQQKSAVYMTSLRYLPSAQLLIDRVRKDHPKYETTIVYVRSPVSTLMDRNLKRHEQIGRFIPEALLMQSVPEVEHSVWDLEPRVNRFLLVVNDENRPLRISYLRKASQIVSTDIAFPDSEPVLKNDEHLKLLSNFLGGSPNSDESALNMNEPDDVFLDIDWTSVYSVRGPHQEDFIHYDKTLYRPTDGLAEFVSALLDIPGVRLSFISGGDRHRNEEVLRTVKLADGSNIFERVYKILSTDEFKRVSDNQNLKFSQRFKK
ncbi:MAG: hypothetical protein JWQ35_1053, partial [Bacteriovoracaceae bacterium]|nr:hypothetical protein [Bacteriovoracaceae bacterium]